MKIASILAGVAIAALSASAASAGDISYGQNIRLPNPATIGADNHALNWLRAVGTPQAGDQFAAATAWHARGNSQGDNGTASNSQGATFTLKGQVATDCAYYAGTQAGRTLNFGAIGIYADDSTGPAAAFTMTGPATLEIATNLAGCNTANTVTVSKVNMVSDNASGYDATVFQNTLPFSVTASYKAGATDSTTASNQSWTVGAQDTTDNRKHGAWKSPMLLNVSILQQSKALLAGNYTGSVSVTIAAGI
ncbi:hypothetical protein V8F63_09255 [Brevundimonas sp. LF-1]|uniref:hypothetical protein n=1 Tax=Brevundimonas sp. LF-1 TaxID=3126100 RepID=UPI0030E14FA9